MKTRFYFGVANFQVLKDKYPEATHIRLLESDSDNPENSFFTQIDSIPLAAVDYFETDNAAEAQLHKWYKFEICSESPYMSFGYTAVILPETLADLIDQIREWIGDTNIEKLVWLDQNLMQMIRFAVKQYKSNMNLTYISEQDVIPTKLLVQKELCIDIAYNHAKYYALTTPQVQLDKSQIMDHYLRVANEIENHYQSISKRLNMESGGYDEKGIINNMPSPKISDATYFDYNLGQFVGQTNNKRRIYGNSLIPTQR